MCWSIPDAPGILQQIVECSRDYGGLGGEGVETAFEELRTVALLANQSFQLEHYYIRDPHYNGKSSYAGSYVEWAVRSGIGGEVDGYGQKVKAMDPDSRRVLRASLGGAGRAAGNSGSSGHSGSGGSSGSKRQRYASSHLLKALQRHTEGKPVRTIGKRPVTAKAWSRLTRSAAGQAACRIGPEKAKELVAFRKAHEKTIGQTAAPLRFNLKANMAMRRALESNPALTKIHAVLGGDETIYEFFSGPLEDLPVEQIVDMLENGAPQRLALAPTPEEYGIPF